MKNGTATRAFEEADHMPVWWSRYEQMKERFDIVHNQEEHAFLVTGLNHNGELVRQYFSCQSLKVPAECALLEKLESVLFSPETPFSALVFHLGQDDEKWLGLNPVTGYPHPMPKPALKKPATVLAPVVSG